MQLTTTSAQPHSPVTVQDRVQSAVLLQLVEGGVAGRPGTVAICPGTDRRDLEVALAYLIQDGSIDGGPARVTLMSLVEMAEAGDLTLTAHGRRRQDANAA